MKRLVVLVTLVLASPVLVSCGDGDGPASLEDYFERLQSANDRFEVGETAFESRLDVALASARSGLTDEIRSELTEALTERARTVGEFAFGLFRVRPPPVLRDQHDALLTLTRNIADALERTAADVEFVKDADGVRKLLATFEADLTRLDQLCASFRSVAVDRAIDVQLDCASA